jgi:hypothetical protein
VVDDMDKFQKNNSAAEEVERRHRIIIAVFVFILLGVFTIIERFVFFYKENLGITLGLAFIDVLNPEWLLMTGGIVFGVLLIVSGVFLGFHRLWLPVLLCVVLILDLIQPIILLLNTVVKSSLPLLVIIVIRIACLKWLGQGIMAVYQRQEAAKKQQLKAADNGANRKLATFESEPGVPNQKSDESDSISNKTDSINIKTNSSDQEN